VKLLQFTQLRIQHTPFINQPPPWWLVEQGNLADTAFESYPAVCCTATKLQTLTLWYNFCLFLCHYGLRPWKEIFWRPCCEGRITWRV